MICCALNLEAILRNDLIGNIQDEKRRGYHVIVSFADKEVAAKIECAGGRRH